MESIEEQIKNMFGHSYIADFHQRNNIVVFTGKSSEIVSGEIRFLADTFVNVNISIDDGNSFCVKGTLED